MTPDEHKSFSEKLVAWNRGPDQIWYVPQWVIDDLRQVKWVPISQVAAHFKRALRK